MKRIIISIFVIAVILSALSVSILAATYEVNENVDMTVSYNKYLAGHSAVTIV